MVLCYKLPYLTQLKWYALFV